MIKVVLLGVLWCHRQAHNSQDNGLYTRDNAETICVSIQFSLPCTCTNKKCVSNYCIKWKLKALLVTSHKHLLVQWYLTPEASDLVHRIIQIKHSWQCLHIHTQRILMSITLKFITYWNETKFWLKQK